MADILEFPFDRISNPLEGKLDVPDHEREMTNMIMQSIVKILVEYRYDPTDPALFKDLGLVMNMLYAALRRTDGMDHFLHENMDVMADLIIDLKKLEDSK